MESFWLVLGAVAGGSLGWFLDKRFRKSEGEQSDCGQAPEAT
jgi:hypothetical protein